MIKSIFVSPLHLDKIESSGANHLIVATDGLDQSNWTNLSGLHMNLSISVNAFGVDGCPANPYAQEKLFGKIKNALQFQPEEIWIDHFRFDGHWEAINEGKFSGIHPQCEFCSGKDRVDILKNIVLEIMKLVNGKTKIGYFAVPFRNDEVTELAIGLGQDHSVIGKIFDMSSPMLYQQMIKRPISYISEYVNWLVNKTQKPVLPIIQIKSMPDDLEDTITEDIITSEFQEAIKHPSIGVCFFWWLHALENNKTEVIKRLFH